MSIKKARNRKFVLKGLGSLLRELIGYRRCGIYKAVSVEIVPARIPEVHSRIGKGLPDFIRPPVPMYGLYQCRNARNMRACH
jgi:hypothetical protein